MITLAHISDLHFGTEESSVADGLVRDLQALLPSLVIVSGDLTQRARPEQFEAARDYLGRLPHPQIVVPGNHDVPLYDVLRRFLSPLTAYQKFISSELNPVATTEEFCVIGLNTARSPTWKGGRISFEQVAKLEEQLRAAEGKFKIVVTHHPFIPPPDDEGIDLVGRGAEAVKVLDALRVDVVLAGHLHRGYAGDIRTHYPVARRAIIAAQAGTAISRRVRQGEPNAYNVLRLHRDQITIEVRAWNGAVFASLRQSSFMREAVGWLPQLS